MPHGCVMSISVVPAAISDSHTHEPVMSYILTCAVAGDEILNKRSDITLMCRPVVTIS